MSNCKNEIIGVKTIALYVNKDVIFNRPDPAVENEIDLIAHAEGSVVISDTNEYPKWSRKIDYSGNYKQFYQDTFSFFLHGIENDTPAILKFLRQNRKGFITEIITTGNKSFVFPSPVFVSDIYEKQDNSHSWEVVLSYRKPTFQDKLNKLNTLLMTHSYILVGDNKILGDGLGNPIIAN